MAKQMTAQIKLQCPGGMATPAHRATGFGLALADFNHDGALDAVLVNGKVFCAVASPDHELGPFWSRYAEPNHIFVNDGKGRFTDVTQQARVAGDLISMAAIAADFDNDGNADLFVTGFGHAILYRNKGGGVFEDVTESAGVKVTERLGLGKDAPEQLVGKSLGVIVCDADGDGYHEDQRDHRGCDPSVAPLPGRGDEPVPVGLGRGDARRLARERVGDAGFEIGGPAHASASRSCSSARWSRDFTVPGGIFRTRAISASERSR